MKIKPTFRQLAKQMGAESPALPPRFTRKHRKAIIAARIAGRKREESMAQQGLKSMDGPWNLEPDVVEWRDPATGYKCLIRKHPIFATLMGYVRITRAHPMYRKGTDRLWVHGGVTFSRIVRGSRYMKRGRWIGFDCAHAGDYLPGTEALLAAIMPERTQEEWRKHDVYRGGGYVKQEVTKLAAQLKKLERK